MSDSKRYIVSGRALDRVRASLCELEVAVTECDRMVAEPNARERGYSYALGYLMGVVVRRQVEMRVLLAELEELDAEAYDVGLNGSRDGSR